MFPDLKFSDAWACPCYFCGRPLAVAVAVVLAGGLRWLGGSLSSVPLVTVASLVNRMLLSIRCVMPSETSILWRSSVPLGFHLENDEFLENWSSDRGAALLSCQSSATDPIGRGEDLMHALEGMLPERGRRNIIWLQVFQEWCPRTMHSS